MTVTSTDVTVNVALPKTHFISGKITAKGAAKYAVFVEAFIDGSFYSSTEESATGTYSLPFAPGTCTLWFFDASQTDGGGWYGAPVGSAIGKSSEDWENVVRRPVWARSRTLAPNRASKS